jgi:hypothetical protein
MMNCMGSRDEVCTPVGSDIQVIAPTDTIHLEFLPLLVDGFHIRANVCQDIANFFLDFDIIVLKLLLNPELNKLLPFFLVSLLSLITPFNIGDDRRNNASNLSSSLIFDPTCRNKLLHKRKLCAQLNVKLYLYLAQGLR